MKVKYISNDGIEFDNKKECEFYEMQSGINGRLSEICDSFIKGHLLMVSDVRSRISYFLTAHKDANHLKYLIQHVCGNQYTVNGNNAVVECYTLHQLDSGEELKIKHSIVNALKSGVELTNLSTVVNCLYTFRIDNNIFYLWGDEHLVVLLRDMKLLEKEDKCKK